MFIMTSFCCLLLGWNYIIIEFKSSLIELAHIAPGFHGRKGWITVESRLNNLQPDQPDNMAESKRWVRYEYSQKKKGWSAAPQKFSWHHSTPTSTYWSWPGPMPPLPRSICRAPEPILLQRSDHWSMSLQTTWKSLEMLSKRLQQRE